MGYNEEKEEIAMKKMKVLVSLVLTLILASSLVGCGERVNEQDPAAAPDIMEDTINPDDETVIEIPIDDNEMIEPPIDGGHIDVEIFPETISFEEKLAGLTENEYPDLVVTAAVLERMAILPGSTFRVNVVIENQGEETVTFVIGSGSNVVPDALLINPEGLQPMRPVEGLGIATMDFQVDFLEPGEVLNFDLYVRAIQPNVNFANYSFELFQSEQEFIGDMDWETLSQRFPDLIAVAPGSYTISVYFLYSIAPDSNMNVNLECNLAGDAGFDIFGGVETGFNVSTFEVYISE